MRAAKKTRRTRTATTQSLSDGRAVEQVLAELFARQPPAYKFTDWDEELDAVAAWKGLSVFGIRPSDQADLERLLHGAARRMLRAVVVPNIDGSEILELEVYICRPSDYWRVEALRQLGDRIREAGRGWTDDFIRVESMLRGYDVRDTEAWVQQNQARSGFWSGWRRAFIGFETSNEDRYAVARTRRLPTQLSNWWTVALPPDWSVKKDSIVLDPRTIVVKTALDQDSLGDEYSVGETLTFKRWQGVRARRTCRDGSKINKLVRDDVRIVAISDSLGAAPTD
jgi:hypothetical protein